MRAKFVEIKLMQITNKFYMRQIPFDGIKKKLTLPLKNT